MILTRRELSAILPSLAAPLEAGNASNSEIPSRCYPFENMAVKVNPETLNQARSVFNGETHTGVNIELHITTLAPGQMPHPPHQHIHEEMIMLQLGMLEVTILGQSTRLGPGSVAYVRSNELHGWKNVGTLPAQYFVVALGKDTP